MNFLIPDEVERLVVCLCTSVKQKLEKHVIGEAGIRCMSGMQIERWLQLATTTDHCCASYHTARWEVIHHHSGHGVSWIPVPSTIITFFLSSGKTLQPQSIPLIISQDLEVVNASRA
jgi:hypothetical protein